MNALSKNSIYYLLLFALTLFLMFASIVTFAQEAEAATPYKLEMSFFKEDTLNKVKVVLSSTEADTAKSNKAIKNVEIKIYAKKSFGLLPLSPEGTSTDATGTVVIDFPTDLPGDSLGNVMVIAKIEDNDVLGNLEVIKEVKWGIPKFTFEAFHNRALWGTAANAPLPLVISVTSMIVGVWGVIFYIISRLFKINKL